MNQSLPQLLFFTADPVLALEIKAIQLSYAGHFNIQCNRQLSELKNTLENEFCQVLFLDLSFQNAPLGIVNIINRLSPATLIFLIEGSSGANFAKLCEIVNGGRIYRYLPRPFNITPYLPDIEQAIERAALCYKMIHAGIKIPMIISETLPEIILLHPDFRFGAQVKNTCHEIARVFWAANLTDLSLLMEKHTPYAVLIGHEDTEGTLLPACHYIHHYFPSISFGMILDRQDKDTLINGINYCGILQVNNREKFLADPEAFLSRLYDTYEHIVSESWRMNLFASLPLPPNPEILPARTREFIAALSKITAAG